MLPFIGFTKKQRVFGTSFCHTIVERVVSALHGILYGRVESAVFEE